MELRLQQFIASVEQLADIRNLDVFNPIIFQLEHPVTALRYTVAGSKTEPSYLGIPVNTTWVVLDPANPYFRQAVKLRDIEPVDQGTTLPRPQGMPSLSWHLVRTYDEIFQDPQYYVTNAGPRGPKGDKGDPGAAGPMPVLDLAALLPLLGYLTSITGTLEITGAAAVAGGTMAPYTLSLTEPEISLTGIATPTTRTVVSPIAIIGPKPASVTIDTDNVLHVGVLAANTSIRLYAEYPSWTKMVSATYDVNLTKAAATGITVVGASSIYAGNSATFAATAQFDDGTSAPVVATWSVDATTYANVGLTGVLTALNPINENGTVMLTATAIINGVTFTAQKSVSILKLIALSLTINGPSAINVGNTATYTANVSLNSGATNTVVPTWSLQDTKASITTGGVLTALASGAEILSATYMLPGASSPVTATKSLTLVAVTTPVMPFYGTGPALPTVWQTFITSLPYRGSVASANADISFDAIGQTTYMYFAYPVSYGLAQFFDKLSQFYGGWGGAGNAGQGPSAASNTAGSDTPLTTNININGISVPFYVYRSDFANLGPASGNKWLVSPAP